MDAILPYIVVKIKYISSELLNCLLPKFEVLYSGFGNN